MADRLGSYHGKRDFTRTDEPRGDASTPAHPEDGAGGGRFVIQHHLATADHYDFRLEIGGVLVSWAVPKGPSLDPRDRRMAKRTEDHPMDYETFEGVINRGQYGGGTVQVWDNGTYTNASTDHGPRGHERGGRPVDAQRALDAGHLTFVLHGQKLQGGYSLIRTGGDGMWLLIKKRDADADARRRPTSTQNESVLTGRTLDQIAADG